MIREQFDDKKTQIIPIRDVKYAFLGMIFYMSSLEVPRKISEISKELTVYLKKNFNCYNGDFWYFEGTFRNFFDMFKPFLETSEAFLELNLTQNEFDKGVKITDQRAPFAFVSAYSTIPENEDFIDLAAFEQNFFAVLVDNINKQTEELKND